MMGRKGASNLELFMGQARLRDQLIDAWFPSASMVGKAALAVYLGTRVKHDDLPMRLYQHQEEMDRLDEAIAQEE